MEHKLSHDFERFFRRIYNDRRYTPIIAIKAPATALTETCSLGSKMEKGMMQIGTRAKKVEAIQRLFAVSRCYEVNQTWKIRILKFTFP